MVDGNEKQMLFYQKKTNLEREILGQSDSSETA